MTEVKVVHLRVSGEEMTTYVFDHKYRVRLMGEGKEYTREGFKSKREMVQLLGGELRSFLEDNL